MTLPTMKKLCNRREICGTSQSDETTQVEPVTSLMELCIIFVANNLHFVDSFLGFPDIVGERIFQKALSLDKFSGTSSSLEANVSPFSAAYGSIVLDSLSLSGEHLVINNYLETICLFTDLSKLDVSCCGLGDDHELLQHLSQLHSLQILNLRCNAMTDNGMRKLTAPARMFKQGLQVLRNIDISGNLLTEKGVKYLSSLPMLKIIHLSENKVKKYSLFRQQGFYLSNEMEELCRGVFDIGTHGWATPVIQAWTTQAQKPLHKTKRSTFYRSQNITSKPSKALPPPPIYSHVLVSNSLHSGNMREQASSSVALDSTSSTMSRETSLAHRLWWRRHNMTPRKRI
ncbi:leucine-rich repeat-containing protein 42-like [Haliotis rubra]|uniref:leucine-rich repeat-containing protein 42-like n=1 Tax=Haliotis rubra TaxID=36100 RepID=UPI001EE509DD|nr:leucine-rich repeat-containing protein 42-like [Haliotis rubra]